MNEDINRKYLAGLPLVEALWWFIENIDDNDRSNRNTYFFDLRERYRNENQPAPKSVDDYSDAGFPEEQHLQLIPYSPPSADMLSFLASVKSLISDIESMQYQHQDWFGPFSEYEETAGDDTMSVEWPNLRISLDAVQAELNKLSADQGILGTRTNLIITDEIRVHGSERDLDWNELDG